MKNKNIKASSDTSGLTSRPILGTYEGECADSNITNLNGLDITRPVWETVFASEDYKKAIELGWYIGYLGHPEDPNCMDFEHACIVMTDGWIDNEGKVHGKFNLIDTPVGRIVYAFQKAGVIFGISVRGAGDIVGNSVDPETFIFRGFDLVTFPAFPESIPTFTEIAASSDIESQKKYQTVCAAINKDIDKVTDINALNVLQTQFAKQSKEYAAIEAQKNKIMSAQDINSSKESDIDHNVLAAKLDAMTKLYIEATTRIHELAEENEVIKLHSAKVEANYNRKIKSLERITASQLKTYDSDIQHMERKYNTVVAANQQLKKVNSSLENSNLKYKMKIDLADETIDEKDAIISSMRVKLNETVNDAKDSQNRASNLDAKINGLLKKVEAAERLQQEYQSAYVQLYANAAGVDLSQVNITASMSVSDVQSVICGSSRVPELGQEPEEIDIEDFDDLDEDSLVTM